MTFGYPSFSSPLNPLTKTSSFAKPNSSYESRQLSPVKPIYREDDVHAIEYHESQPIREYNNDQGQPYSTNHSHIPESNKDAALIASAAYARALKDTIQMQSAGRAEAPGSHIVIQNHSQATAEAPPLLDRDEPKNISLLDRGMDLYQSSMISFQVFWKSRLNRVIFCTGMGISFYLFMELKRMNDDRKLKRARMIMMRKRPLQRFRSVMNSMMVPDEQKLDAQMILQNNQNRVLYGGPLTWLFGF